MAPSHGVAVEDGSASYVHGALVTGAYFDVLGIHPFLGRALTPTDDVAGAGRLHRPRTCIRAAGLVAQLHNRHREGVASSDAARSWPHRWDSR